MENICDKKSTKKSCSCAGNCARNFIFLSQHLASGNNFVRLALHTWLINSVIKRHLANQLSNKTQNLCFMDTNGKETATDM